MKKYGITVMNELEKNVLEVSLDHMEEHLEALIDSNLKHNSIGLGLEHLDELREKLEACKNLKNSLK